MSGAAADLGPPPTHADEKKAPVVEELRTLAFKGVADELKAAEYCMDLARPGELVVLTSRGSRWLAAVGAIPHWLYFAPLRLRAGDDDA